MALLQSFSHYSIVAQKLVSPLAPVHYYGSRGLLLGGKGWEWGAGIVCEQMFAGLDGDSQDWCPYAGG